VKLTIHLRLVPKLEMSEAVSLVLYIFMEWTGKAAPLLLPLMKCVTLVMEGETITGSHLSINMLLL